MDHKLIFYVITAFLVLHLPFDKGRYSGSSVGHGHMPAMAVDKQGVVHAVYGSHDSLMYTSSVDKGKTFSTPQLVAVVQGLFSTATRGPRVAVTDHGVAVITTMKTGNVFCFVKTEKNEWSKPIRVTDADTVNLEGFADVASDGHSNLFAAWLDLRGNRRNKIYGARSSDGGKSWTSNMEIYTSPDTTVCECCRISVAMEGKQVVVMFRNWLDGNRDMYIIKSQDAGKTFDAAHKMGKGSWALKGCPMDGGGVAIKSGIAHTVWRRENTIYSCAEGGMELPVGEGRSCTIAAFNGANAYAWVDKGNVVCKVGDGMPQTIGEGSSPVIAAVDSHTMLCMWEQDDVILRQLVEYRPAYSAGLALH